MRPRSSSFLFGPKLLWAVERCEPVRKVAHSTFAVRQSRPADVVAAGDDTPGPGAIEEIAGLTKLPLRYESLGRRQGDWGKGRMPSGSEPFVLLALCVNSFWRRN